MVLAGRAFTHLKLPLVLLLVLLLQIPAFWSHAASSSRDEYEIKAALVYNFARFTQWPDSDSKPDSRDLEILVFGDQTLTWPFTGINGKLVGKRRIRVRFTQNPLEAGNCEILFLAKTEREQWPKVLAALDGAPVLTIGEMNGFLETQGILNLVRSDNKIRFQANLINARARGISISSRILKLASQIIDDQEGEK